MNKNCEPDIYSLIKNEMFDNFLYRGGTASSGVSSSGLNLSGNSNIYWEVMSFIINSELCNLRYSIQNYMRNEANF